MHTINIKPSAIAGAALAFLLALGFTTSAAEEIQKMLPKVHVVKAFNTVFAQNQSAGKIGG